MLFYGENLTSQEHKDVHCELAFFALHPFAIAVQNGYHRSYARWLAVHLKDIAELKEKQHCIARDHSNRRFCAQNPANASVMRSLQFR